MPHFPRQDDLTKNHRITVEARHQAGLALPTFSATEISKVYAAYQDMRAKRRIARWRQAGFALVMSNAGLTLSHHIAC
jgi:hypothetical protein